MPFYRVSFFQSRIHKNLKLINNLNSLFPIFFLIHQIVYIRIVDGHFWQIYDTIPLLLPLLHVHVHVNANMTSVCQNVKEVIKQSYEGTCLFYMQTVTFEMNL